jgi:O-methyltransferase
MLARGKICADAQKLVACLIKTHPKKRVELAEIRGFVSVGASGNIVDRQKTSESTAPFYLPNGSASNNLVAAFRDVESHARQTGVEAPFFHCCTRLASGEFLTPENWAYVADREEKHLGFTGQPRAVALHHFSDHSIHMHIAWSRITCTDDGRVYAIDPGAIENKLKEICRQLEPHFGLVAIRGLKAVEPYVPAPLWKWIRWQKKLRLQCPLEFNRFVAEAHARLETKLCKQLRNRYLRAHFGIHCVHTHAEILEITNAILSMPSQVNGVVVEAGCFKGGSTAKLSIAAKFAKRKLVVFDSFAGLPDPKSSDRMKFYQGEYAGSLDEVRDNVKRYGEISACEFRKGWFSDTMPSFTEPVAVAFVDVDLSDSVQTCLKYLYPLVVPGGVIFSHDGHVPSCVAVMQDRSFWKDEVGVEAPLIPGLGEEKFLRIEKPRTPASAQRVSRNPASAFR